MAQYHLKRAVKRFSERNKAIDSKTADLIAQRVLVDGFHSRTEKRFLRGLLKRERLDKAVQMTIYQVLADG